MIPTGDHIDTRDQIDPATAAELLRRAGELTAGAAEVVANLKIGEMVRDLGELAQLGSSVTGLMTWRDIDFTVFSPGATPEHVWAALHPLLIDPRLVQLTFRNDSGARTPAGNPSDARYYLVLQIETAPETVWKIDISVWLAESKDHQVAETAALRRRLAPETRLAILWIKDIWHRKPEYPLQVSGIDIYHAVLDHGVRTPNEFAAWLSVHNP